MQLTPRPLADCYDIHRDHSFWEAAYDGGKMDGWNLNPVKPAPHCDAPPNPQYIYVDNSTGTVQPYFDIALNYGFANRMFHTNQGMAFPAHEFLFGGTSAPTADSDLFNSENGEIPDLVSGGGCLAPLTFRVQMIKPNGSESLHGDNGGPAERYPCFEHKTLADLIEAAKLSWKYYTPALASIWTAPNAIRHICKPAVQNGQRVCTGREFTDHVVPEPVQMLADIKACNLASVSWLMPRVRQSDHNQVNDGTGPQWVASIVDALGSNPACKNGESVLERHRNPDHLGRVGWLV